MSNYLTARRLYNNKDYGTLKTMMNDRDRSVRYWVAEGLYENEDYNTLKTMINDSNDSVRICVGYGLVDTEDWNTLKEFLDKEKNVWVKDEIGKMIEKYILRKHFGVNIKIYLG